ncbi:hypothetical protein N568_0103035 [Lactococcus garvieae TRF1]|uniref:Uncharacterized protein n=1 Tax=Lactococcus garvieae TRF1 TaxID=1380772 RepID=V8AR33_9LACT|nr:hypothetical protein N568_0103035 [Lactococcus garvieae TRF1]
MMNENIPLSVERNAKGQITQVFSMTNTKKRLTKTLTRTKTLY